VTAATEQARPVPNGRAVIWFLVMNDMATRHRVGVERYGTPLQAHNGRDALRDLYEELLDAVVYLRQVMEERDTPMEQQETGAMDDTGPAEAPEETLRRLVASLCDDYGGPLVAMVAQQERDRRTID
jgi:hypothetical protein